MRTMFYIKIQQLLLPLIPGDPGKALVVMEEWNGDKRKENKDNCSSWTTLPSCRCCKKVNRKPRKAITCLYGPVQ